VNAERHPLRLGAVLIPCLLVLGCAGTGGSASTGVQTVAVSPQGQYATIEVDDSNRMVERLSAADPAAVERVLAAPERYNPAVLYALSAALFEQDRKREAAFWFYSGQLKARSDANKALDDSAHQAVSVLNERYGRPINTWAFQDRSLLRTIVERVVEADRSTARDYDPRWIAAHGLDAFTEDAIRFVDEAAWSDIDETTRSDYLANFNRAMDAMDARDEAAGSQEQ